jgi:glucokinase
VESIADQSEELLLSLLKAADVPRERIVGTGVSVAGLVDKRTGYVKFSPDFNWRNVYFKQVLEDRLALPVVINNCTRVAALGEMWYGAARESNTFFFVNVGYGIGSAIVINRRLYEHNSEFGHINVTNREVKCDCGKFGCLEAVSSGHAIERDANREVGEAEDAEWTTARELAERAVDGDARARQIFEDAGKYLGRGIATVANLLSPELVILGGGVSNAGTLLMAPLMREFSRHTMEAIKEGISVEVASLGIDAGVIGAVALALDTFVFEQDTIHGM